jgi:hypothetical protein
MLRRQYKYHECLAERMYRGRLRSSSVRGQGRDLIQTCILTWLTWLRACIPEVNQRAFLDRINSQSRFFKVQKVLPPYLKVVGLIAIRVYLNRQYNSPLRRAHDHYRLSLLCHHFSHQQLYIKIPSLAYVPPPESKSSTPKVAQEHSIAQNSRLRKRCTYLYASHLSRAVAHRTKRSSRHSRM